MTPYQRHKAKWKDCNGCELARQRKRVVLVRGYLPCQVLFIGEAPGSSEDLLGKPFIGPAGKLFDRILAESLPQGCRFALTNLVGCFPREAKRAGINAPPKAAIEVVDHGSRSLSKPWPVRS